MKIKNKEQIQQIAFNNSSGINLNNTQWEKLCFSPFSTKMAAWLLLTFFICLHNQLGSIYSIIMC